MTRKITKGVVNVLRKAAASYCDTKPTEVPGIKGKADSSSLTPMAAGEKKSKGPVPTDKNAGCKSGGGMKHKRPVSGTTKVKKATVLTPTLWAEKLAFSSMGSPGMGSYPSAGAQPAAPTPKRPTPKPPGGLSAQDMGGPPAVPKPPQIPFPDLNMGAGGGGPLADMPDMQTLMMSIPGKGGGGAGGGAGFGSPPGAGGAVMAPRNRYMSPKVQGQHIQSNVNKHGLGTVQQRAGGAALANPQRGVNRHFPKAGSARDLAIKLAMMKVGPVTETKKINTLQNQRDKDKSEARLRQTL